MVSNRRPRSGGRFDRFLTRLRDHAEEITLAVIFGLVVRWFVASAFLIGSEQMAPNLLPGDVVLANRLPFGFRLPWMALESPRLPRLGELVFFNCPREPETCLRRVVGLPGDRLEMVKQRLVRNQKPCSYERATGAPSEGELAEDCGDWRGQIQISGAWPKSDFSPLIVPPGQVFVLNDSRGDWSDSRVFGAVPLENLEARVVGTLLSFDWRESGLPRLRWRRMLRAVH